MFAVSESGIKLLAFLKIKMGEGISAKQIKRLIEENCCRVNGRVERFASTQLLAGDHVELDLPEIQSIKQSIAFEKNRILYQDEALLVYDKPAGIPSLDHGLAEILSQVFPGLQLVHRLDRDTSGLIIFAKNSTVFEKMVAFFREKRIVKTYLAIVDGVVRGNGVIENYLAKLSAFEGQSIWGSLQSGKKGDKPHGLYAKTEWHSESVGKEASLVSCSPITGRTHQIRVHMSELGHPILGDYQYGRCFSSNFRPQRCLLHAWRLRFSHPIHGKVINLEAPIPQDMQQACIALQIYTPSS